jgi:hypothetical protein
MAFPDPQTLAKTTASTVGATVYTTPRTGMSDSAAKYSTADGNLTLSISHQIGKRVRRVVRLDYKAILADPLLTGVNAEQSMSVYIVVDAPKQGFTQTTQKDFVDHLTTWLSSSSYANTFKFLGGEI